MTKPGWGAVVQGEPTDLEGWVDNLKEPFDPWVEIHGDQTVLRSAAFDELTSGDDVRDRAVALIERLNGIVALSQNAGPLRFGNSIVKFGQNGRMDCTMFLVGASAARGKARGVGVSIGPDGHPIPQLPQPSEVQRWAVRKRRRLV